MICVSERLLSEPAGNKKGREAALHGQEREKYEVAAKRMKRFQSERELRMLSLAALGGNNKNKVL